MSQQFDNLSILATDHHNTNAMKKTNTSGVHHHSDLNYELPSRQATITPTLSGSETIQTSSSPLTPTVSSNYHSNDRHLENGTKQQQDSYAQLNLPSPNVNGTSYSMEQMLDILKDMESKNQIPVDGPRDSSQAKYRVADGSGKLRLLQLLQQQNAGNAQKANSQSQFNASNFKDNVSSTQLNVNSSLLDNSFLNQQNPASATYTSTGWNQTPGVFGNGLSFDTSKPPGLSSIPSVLSPDQIKWVYLDSLGNVQGPFDGFLMQKWYSANYLSLDLSLKRVEEDHYETLGDLIKRLGEFQNPFLVPLEAVVIPQQPPHIHQPHSVSHGISSPVSAIPQRVLSPWGPPPQPIAQPQILAVDFLNTRSQSPFLGSASLNSGSPFVQSAFGQSSFIGAPQTPQIDDDRILEHLQSTVLDNVLQDTHLDDRKFVGNAGLDLQQEVPQPQVEQQQQHQKESQSQSQLQEPKDKRESEKTSSENIKEKTISASEVSDVAEISKPKPTEPLVASTQTPRNPSSKLETASKKESSTKPVAELPASVRPETNTNSNDTTATTTEKPAPLVLDLKPAKPKLAPWASSSAIKAKPQVSLMEIQELESQERLKAQKAKEQELKLNSAKILTSAVASPVDSKPLLPRTASWANKAITTTPVVPEKTLADILKEEEEAGLAAEKERKQKASLAARLAETSALVAASADWTVVSKKPAKPVVKKTVPGMSVNTVKSTNPTLLRSVSAQASTPVVPPPLPTSSVAPAVAPVRQLANSRDEFFDWCRQQLSQLNKGVDREDVLSILIQMPASNESQEIIADTVYSNSSTIDGRRFAQEFCKKKLAIEKSVPRGIAFDWTEEMLRTLSSAPDSSTSLNSGDGWEDAFKVVTKKKNRKNKEF